MPGIGLGVAQQSIVWVPSPAVASLYSFVGVQASFHHIISHFYSGQRLPTQTECEVNVIKGYVNTSFFYKHLVNNQKTRHQRAVRTM